MSIVSVTKEQCKQAIKGIGRLRYESTFNRFQNHTMIRNDAYVLNLELANRFRRIPGHVVECGTWRGGMIGGLASILGDDREYFLFDSFEGLPPAQEIDGDRAIRWQADKSSPAYLDNCAAEERFAREAMKLSGATRYTLVKGWFNETLPKMTWTKPIAILRLDGDWYESTMSCLDALFPQVAKGGVIIVDDYYVWDGCSRAVHDYLSKHSRPERIRQYSDSICHIIKE